MLSSVVSKHRAGGTGFRTAALAVAGVVIIGGGATAIALNRNDPQPSPSAVQTTSGTTGPSMTSSGSTPSASTAPTTAPTTASTTAPTSAAPTAAVDAAAIKKCGAEVAAGEALARAARASATDWGLHTGALAIYNSGQHEKANTIWAQSKKRAPADVTAYQAAAKGYAAVRGSCAGAAKGLSTPALKACQSHVSALGAQTGAGARVEGEWEAHIAMMKTKAEANQISYYKKWVSMVHDAGPGLKAFHAADNRLKAAPRCPASAS